MDLALALAFLGGGLAILVFGAEYLVKGSASLATRIGVPPLAIGLTIVAFGTSTPELTVNLYSAITGATDIAIGNVVGSNIANILLILGVSSLVAPLVVKNSTVWKEMPFALLAGGLLLVLGADQIISGAGPDMLTRGDGLALMGVFAIFMYYVVGLARANREATNAEAVEEMPLARSIVCIVMGLGALVLGGKILVDQAVFLAQLVGLSEAVIGLTVVAVGTSLPELATSVIAAIRGQYDIAVGNIIGSNIFNIFWILGLTAVIAPLPISQSFGGDILVLLLTTLLLFLFMFTGRKFVLDRFEGASFVILYIAYVVFLLTQH
ncbi:calcium/sodium antiporter [Patescibacteria group bacterium]|nr:calcium/sodium antiporter [Patescibacteria group bacterium]